MVVQRGTLPLRPNGTRVPFVEHRCTSVLLWPEGEGSSLSSKVLTDPCFTKESLRAAERLLHEKGIALSDIDRTFVTHPHRDHQINLPYDVPGWSAIPYQPGDSSALTGISVISCPGHSSEGQALVFTSATEAITWIVGDAVLNMEWLMAWNFYWPNCYSAAHIVQTWRTLAGIIAEADVIVPGHGRPIAVSANLVQHLIDSFPRAAHADSCGDVAERLRRRLVDLLRWEAKTTISAHSVEMNAHSSPEQRSDH
jgi:glyoxylase-like metal-dependent hydrolase (beta-lactamase superfamily II)